MILSVAPQWALASYSCVMGKSKKITENEDVPWRLQVGSSVNETIQVPIARIYKYPQVRNDGKLSVPSGLYHFPLYRPNSNTSSIRAMLFF